MLAAVPWFFGYFHLSFAWIVLFLSLGAFLNSGHLLTQRKRPRKLHKKVSKEDDVKDLWPTMPSWIYFSEEEHAIWVNRILDQMWPFVEDMVEGILKKSVEPAIQQCLPGPLQCLCFEKISLGQTPLYITNIRTYNACASKQDDEFIMDLDIVYNGDADFELGIKKVKLGISDFELHGPLRVIFKPLVPECNPVGGITVFFLNRPKISFELTNLLSVLEIPGIKWILQDIVEDVVASFVVLPNRIAVPLALNVDCGDLQYPIPDGVLRVEIIEAKDLIKADMAFIGEGSSDPYCIVEVGAQKFRSKTRKNNCNPVWKETFESFIDNTEGQQLFLKVYDEDIASKDEEIGHADCQVSRAIEKGVFDLWLQLQGVKEGRIHMNLSWFTLTSNPEDVRQATPVNPTVAALFVKIISAVDLPNDLKNEADPKWLLCNVRVGKTTQDTYVVSSITPTWNQGMRFLVSNPRTECVRINIMEDDKILCHVNFDIKRIENVPGMTHEGAFPLTGPGFERSALKCRVELRAMKAPEVHAVDVGEETKPAESLPNDITRSNFRKSLPARLNTSAPQLSETEVDSDSEGLAVRSDVSSSASVSSSRWCMGSMTSLEPSVEELSSRARPFYKRIYHNARDMSKDDIMEYGRYFIVTLSLWLVGHFHFSFAWIVMILMVFVSWQFEIEKKRKHRDNLVKAHMSSFIHKFQNMPSWVYFSDKEHAEWINKILYQMWPYVGDMVCDILKNTVEPEMQKNLPKALNSLYFDKITLGNKPPLIKSVSSYDHTDKAGAYIMDLDLKYDGDAQVKLAVKNVKLGLNNFQLQGVLRVIFKPLVSNYNPIGGVTVFFLNRPKTKFDLTNLLNVLDLPGLKSTLRRIVNDTVASFVVLPNRVAVPLAEGVDGSDLQYPIPEGVLRVKLVQARDLVAKDFGIGKKGKSDPYSILEIGAQSFRSKVINNSLNPTWNETYEAFVDNSEGQKLELTVWDEDTTSKDSSIGSIETSIASAVEQGQHDVWLPLEGVKEGRVHLKLSWNPLTSNPAHLHAAEYAEDSVAALFIKIVRANNLPSNKKTHLNSVFCEVTVVNTTLKTFVAYGENLEWKQGLRFLLKNPNTNEAKIKVIEAKGNRRLGHVTYKVQDLLQKRGMREEKSFVLQESGEKSTLTCRLTLRILGLPGAKQVPDDDVDTVVAGIQSNSSKTRVDGPPIPTLTVNDGEEPEDDHEKKETGSDQGSVYEENSCGERSLEDLTGRGDLELHLKYDHRRNCLVTKVIGVNHLRSRNPENKTNPFVRLYILPDRSKKTRRVTKIIKGSLHGEYRETFQHVIGLDMLADRQLECAVKSDRGLRNRLIGTAKVDLGELDLNEGYLIPTSIKTVKCTVNGYYGSTLILTVETECYHGYDGYMLL
ncbi:hypothetical protein QZH41_007335 [Actinostola sp. cb2023]|nr:hypothetical protein QZH41_007335 [Actinostola sp. cb2023]